MSFDYIYISQPHVVSVIGDFLEEFKINVFLGKI